MNHMKLPRYTRKRDVIKNKRRFRKLSNATFFNVDSLLSLEFVRKRLSSTPETYVLFMYAVNDYIAKQSTTCSFVCRVVGSTNGCPYVANEIKSLIKDGSKFYTQGMIIHFYCPINRQWTIIKEEDIKNELAWMKILMDNAVLQPTDDVDKIKFYRDGHGIKISIDFFQKVKVNETMMIMKAWRKTFRKYFAKALHYTEQKLNIPQNNLCYICYYMFTMMKFAFIV
ncbi:hypothetical protein T4E_8839 [Trichinella pseudospiralis]|uniref:Uncharacterized protein n=1 Tax=Trichinella pseudospiralis TaxID=6337 RepID=A0A0V0YIS6_TRIPS|nr:hypothetical protein T4E_8839 [Trichinella pseudospiralis]